MPEQFEEIIEIEEIGEVDTYDLEINSKHHNFYANGICVSNSHALSYSYLAMQTLYLKHYYTTEFYTALLNHPKTNGGKEKQQQWIASAISSAMSKGIEIKRPSRKSGWDWTMTGEREISMGFSGINGVGEIAYEEMLRLIDEIKVKSGEPKKTLETVSLSVFMRLPFSKFSKGAFAACLKAGVFDDWSESREQLLALKQKRKKKKEIANQGVLFDMNDSAFDIPIVSDIAKYPPTSDTQKRFEFIEVCNFDLEKIKYILDIKSDVNKRAKREKLIETIINFDDNDYYIFVVESFKLVQGKTGKEYLVMRVGDGVSSTTLRAFEPIVTSLYPLLVSNGIYVAEFVKNEKGYINFKKGTRIIRIDNNKK